MIDLPSEPGPQSAEAALLDFGGLLVPPLGGPVQRLNRLGMRYRLSVTMPPLTGSRARQWRSRLERGLTEGVRMEFPLLDFSPGAVGSPLVATSATAGTSLSIKSGTPGYVFKEGQFFSLVSGSVYHLHQVIAEASVDGSGNAALTIWPPLRRAAAVNDPLQFTRPLIEGHLQGNELVWSMALGDFQGFSFEIHEAE